MTANMQEVMSNHTSTADRDLVLSGVASARVSLGGREYINFAGSGYLALGRLPELREAALNALTSRTAFSCQLPSVYGVVDEAIRSLEQGAAKYCGTEEAVYAASGYFIGAAALASIETNDAVLFIDDTAHFSLLDAARLSTRPVVPFRHADADSLAEAIRAELRPGTRPIVLTDGAFATTGRVPPLDQYAAVVANYDGQLVVDEAHSFGVLGNHGRGAADYHGVEGVATIGGTLSKAFCAQGAIIPCTARSADHIRRVPPLRAANAGSPISAAVGAAAIRYMHAHPERRERLSELTGYLRSKLNAMGFDVGDSPAPIIALRIGDRDFMEGLQRRLFEMGLYVLLSNYVGSAGATIRCAVFADHTEADLDALAEPLSKL